jgi:hypothetical protein
MKMARTHIGLEHNHGQGLYRDERRLLHMPTRFGWVKANRRQMRDGHRFYHRPQNDILHIWASPILALKWEIPIKRKILTKSLQNVLLANICVTVLFK